MRVLFFFFFAMLSAPANATNFAKWDKVVAPLAGLPIVRGRARDDWLTVIAQVNQEINTVPYVPEYGADVWQAPKQFYANGGDCEDFAIAKYYRLRREGYRERDMRVTIVRDRHTQEIHAFLALWLNGALIILDNRVNEPMPGERIKDFDVFYSVNRLGFYVPRGRDILPR